MRATPEGYATFGSSFLTSAAGVLSLACARSWFICMRSHMSAVLPIAFSSRSAISGEIAFSPLMTR